MTVGRDKPYYRRGKQALMHGNSFRLLKGLPENSISAVVTDPPYELGFMGQKWDGTGITYDVRFWKRLYRVMKPGAFLLAFGGTRTAHRLAVAIEDAGFEIRDSIIWIYGSGFPKSLDVSKAIDKEAGAKRKVVGSKLGLPGYSLKHSGKGGVLSGRADGTLDNAEKECELTAPTTALARKWNGWGTALKPAHEPIVVARKPLAEKTVAKNVLRYGTGAMNINGSRIKGNVPTTIQGQSNQQGEIYGKDQCSQRVFVGNVAGRWPANVILSPESAKGLDRQSGVSKSPASYIQQTKIKGNVYRLGSLENKRGKLSTHHGDNGGASRFFYVAKASRRERGNGNNHPTVKPLRLVRYLLKMITPPNGVVLDPFCGSGTILVAAAQEGCKAIGIELKQAYCEIAVRRIEEIGTNGNQKG